jgi:hypothetical protein
MLDKLMLVLSKSGWPTFLSRQPGLWVKKGADDQICDLEPPPFCIAGAKNLANQRQSRWKIQLSEINLAISPTRHYRGSEITVSVEV